MDHFVIARFKNSRCWFCARSIHSAQRRGLLWSLLCVYCVVYISIFWFHLQNGKRHKMICKCTACCYECQMVFGCALGTRKYIWYFIKASHWRVSALSMILYRVSRKLRIPIPNCFRFLSISWFIAYWCLISFEMHRVSTWHYSQQLLSNSNLGR